MDDDSDIVHYGVKGMSGDDGICIDSEPINITLALNENTKPPKQGIKRERSAKRSSRRHDLLVERTSLVGHFLLLIPAHSRPRSIKVDTTVFEKKARVK